MKTWLTHLARSRRLPAPTFRPALEVLEDRRLLAGAVLQTNLVSDLPGVAQTLDPQLVNPWGISESAGSAFWISDNNAGVSTLYNTAGMKQGLVVNIPGPPPLDPLGTDGTPTGTVFNIDGGATGGFKVSANGKGPAAAVFLFATEDGTIAGWAPSVDGTHAIIAVDNSGNNFTEPDPAKQTGAVYKGLTIASGNGSPISSLDPDSTFLLYAANFRAGTVDVFDPTPVSSTNPSFKPATLPAGAFTDSSLPKGYAPFDVQVLGGKVYVTYAKQDATKHDDAAGPHRGFVDVFNLDGSPGLAGGQVRLISRGDLNSPWGLALAPTTSSATSNFGDLGGALLVGNFGDGRIHAYNATTGAPMGTLTDPDGEPIQIPGLWALKVGNGGNGGDSSTVYFTAGLDHENHGLFGSLAGVAPGTEGGAEALTEEQMVQAEIDVVSIDVNTLINDITNGAPKATLQQDIQSLHTAEKDLKRAEHRFFVDTHTVFQGSSANGGATLQSLDALFEQLEGLRGHDHDHDLDH